jgi:tetratricopeptide (TPR) repeat protein
VRIEAASLLSEAPANQMPAALVPRYQEAIAEYEASQKLHLDRPDRQVNLALLYAGRGDYEAAESAYRQAIALEPAFVQSSINLADLYRTLDREDEGKAVLTAFLTREPEQAEANYALGLLLVREKQLPQALPHLEKASRNAATPHYSYVYAVALYSAGKTGEAIEFLEAKLSEFPGDPELLSGLISFLDEQGEAARARVYARQFIEFWPTDPITPALRERFGIEN